MKTKWDYTKLATAYLKRPTYSEEAIKHMLEIAGIRSGGLICDVGAGVAHLTLVLAKMGFTIDAVEPNNEMRMYGLQRTEGMPNVKWYEGTGEDTGRQEKRYDMVTFGSSFNVTDRMLALKEVSRITKKNGWFAAMWNHRDLTEPIQSAIEGIIKSLVSGYGYGIRREDQTFFLKESGYFKVVHKIEGEIIHHQKKADVVEAWRSHATLQRQAGDKFNSIIEDIERLLNDNGKEIISVPYTTRIWVGQLN